MEVQQLNFGPYVMKTKCEQSIVDDLLLAGSKLKNKYNHKLASIGIDTYKFDRDTEENFYGRMTPYMQAYRDGHCQFHKIENLDGWGRQSVNNLKYSIEEKKEISLERFIYSLGIRHIGLENAKLISKNIKQSENFLKLSKDKNLSELENLDGIGETQIKSLKNFFLNKKNYHIVFELLKILKIKEANKVKIDGKFKDKTFMLTGKLLNMSRSEAKSLIENNSGSVVSNVSRKLDFLIVGEKPTKRKINAAKELNIKILSQEEWLKILNKAS